MHKAVEKREEAESLENTEEKRSRRGERPCRNCENLIGVIIKHNLNDYGKVQEYSYSCREGLFLSALSGKDCGCPINLFKPRERGEVGLTPESLKENGFRKLSYEKDFANKLDPNHPLAKRYGEIMVHPGEDLLRLMYQIHDVWVSEKNEENRGKEKKVLSRIQVKDS